MSLPIETPADPPPSMGCIVYIAKTETGVAGRVANLPGIVVTASNERDLMRQIVKQFKAEVAPIFARGEQPTWVDPLPQLAENERKVFLPVHL
ncbi:hypothetical protein [Rhodopirellula sp. MGV]|uniref:hypothetical protein n=1 Tax=Rhodopirellula sp. MGV TaxID=2023130 RepID=UPI000B976972|nr:hypothetical protein [Rhodopirellula sp. MGV]OYP34958.1 hypothetical protein CGZ80_13130 [Rhodopirellula sp. MGV]PNY38147.1 hypothetical protein C2E31_03820 [Rhodopirellula baltica]